MLEETDDTTIAQDEINEDKDGQHKIERPANVRLAGPADDDALYDLMLALDEDNSFGIPHDPARVRAAIEKGTKRQGSLIGVIDGKQGRYGESSELAASVCLTLSQWWYADQWFLSETWLFTRPEYRHNRLERDLFNFCHWTGDKMKLPVISSVSSPRRLSAKLRLWSRYGKQVGGIFQVR